MSYKIINTRVLAHTAKPVWIGKFLLQGGSPVTVSDSFFEKNKGLIESLHRKGYLEYHKVVDRPVVVALAEPAVADSVAIEAFVALTESLPELPHGLLAMTQEALEPKTETSASADTKVELVEAKKYTFKELKALCRERGVEYSKADGVTELKQKLGLED